DDRAQRLRTRLPIIEIGTCSHFAARSARLNVFNVRGSRFPQGRGYSTATVEDILSSCGHEIVPAAATSAHSKIHDDRSMVLERGSGSERHVPRSLEKIRIRALPRFAETDSRWALRTRNEHRNT